MQPTGTPVRTPHRQMHFGAYQSAYAQTPVTAAIDALQWINSIEGKGCNPTTTHPLRTQPFRQDLTPCPVCLPTCLPTRPSGLPTTPSARLMEHYSNATPENPQAAIEVSRRIDHTGAPPLPPLTHGAVPMTRLASRR